MKIRVTRVEDLGLDKVFVGGGTCSHSFQFGVFDRFRLHFELATSDGETHKVSMDDIIQTDDTDVERALESLSMNVLKFSHDIKTVGFPDVMFFKTKKAYKEFVADNPGAKMTPLYIGSRSGGKDAAIKKFLKGVVRAYALDESSYYKGNLDSYIRNLPGNLI